METERLIKSLALDGRRPAFPMRNAWGIAAVFAVMVAAIVFDSAIGPRADLAAAAGTVRFLFKFVVTIALFITAFGALRKLSRPGASLRSELPLLFLAPILLGVAVALELSFIPTEEMWALWIGTNALTCLTFIPLIGLGPLVAFLVTLRYGAPTQPTFAGAVAGLVAGGLAATFYAAHCTDDSPLFVATWYPLAIALLAALGALSGRFLLRW